MLKNLPARIGAMGNYKPKIGFRVDAGNIVGTGHLMEIVSLIKSLRKRLEFYAVGVVNDHPLCTEKLLRLVDRLEIIPEDTSEENEMHLVFPLVKEEGFSFFITDLLNRSPEYYALLKKEVGNTCAIFDNADHTAIPASVVINFSILQSPEFYENMENTDVQYLIGPRYAILDESLYDTWSKAIAFRDQVRRIFVNQGGGDPCGLTARILKALERLQTGCEVIVVVGGALRELHKKELEDLKSSLKGNYRFFENIPQEKMYELMAGSDIALTAAGNTLYELSFFGIPSIVIGHHENHNKVASKFYEQGAAINLGIGTRIHDNYIEKATELLLWHTDKRKELSTNARSIVDGYGTGRIADKITESLRCAI